MGTYAIDHAARVTVRAVAAGHTSRTGDGTLATWLTANASSDELMAAVRYVTVAAGQAQVPLLRRIARLAGCPHTAGRCTGILAARGYPGHHAPGLYEAPTA